MGSSLEGKVAVVYGAGGAIGAAVARAWASEGARVHATGRRIESLAPLRAAGLVAEAAAVDALDETAVEHHLRDVVATHGRLDLSFNAVGFDEVQGVPLVDLRLDDFMFPLLSWPRTAFLTARAAARHMTPRRSGLILGVKPAAQGTALASGFGAAQAAIESIHRTHAAELGPSGVRVLMLQPSALPESRALQQSVQKYARGAGLSPEAVLGAIRDASLLRVLPTLEQLAQVATFLASEHAAMLTGTVIGVDGGRA